MDTKNNNGSLYTFTVKKQKEVEVITDTEQGKLIKKEIQDVPIKVMIKKPTRSQAEEAELFNNSEFYRFVRAGIPPRKVAEKMFEEQGLGNESRNRIEELRTEMIKIVDGFREKFAAKGEDISQEDKDALNKEFAAAIEQPTQELQRLESENYELYSNTAEIQARNRTVFWWFLHNAYIKDETVDFQPLFKGKTFDDKFKYYDKLSDEGKDYILEALDRLTTLTTHWTLGGLHSTDDFERVDRENFPEAFKSKDSVEEKDNDTSARSQINQTENEPTSEESDK